VAGGVGDGNLTADQGSEGRVEGPSLKSKLGCDAGRGGGSPTMGLRNTTEQILWEQKTAGGGGLTTKLGRLGQPAERDTHGYALDSGFSR